MAQKQKHERILKGYMKKPENKVCADCGGPSATTVDVIHNIFICTQCAGIHRELNDRVKNVSMAAFTAEEVEALGRTTNRDFNAKWMARWNPSEMPLPNGASDDQRRKFLNAKYVEKRWYSDAGGGSVAAAPVGAPSAPKAETPFQSAPQPAQGSPFAGVQASGGANPFVAGGQPAAGGNPFAQQAQPQPQQGNPFAQQQQPQQSNPFGQPQQQPSPFGQPQQQPSPFGQQPQQPSPFGQQPQQSNPFGQQPQQSNPFGQPQQQNLFASPAPQQPQQKANNDLFGDDLLDICASPQPAPVQAPKPSGDMNGLKGLVDLMGPEEPMNAPVNPQTLRQAGIGTPLPQAGMGFPGPQPMGFPAQQPMGFPPRGPQPMGFPGQQPMGFPGQQPMGFPGQQPMGFPGQQPMGFPGQQPMNMQRGFQQNPFG